ncbi:MAG: GTPase ObgE, partial [Bacteroidales bacterium]
MAQSNFVDYVKIYFRSGKGGAGSVHFRREKFIPKGGPDGGDGGRGGHIILRGNKQLWTLLHLKYNKHIFAENGQPGGGSRSTGTSGEDRIIEVPLGTVAKEAESGKKMFEITEHGEEKIMLPGGKGGLGNTNFKTSTNQTPRYAQPGEEGMEGWYILELKLLA